MATVVVLTTRRARGAGTRGDDGSGAPSATRALVGALLGHEDDPGGSAAASTRDGRDDSGVPTWRDALTSARDALDAAAFPRDTIVALSSTTDVALDGRVALTHPVCAEHGARRALFVGDGVADPIGRILTGWALARSRGGGGAAAAGEGTPSKEEKPKALAPWQYQFFYFGVKSVPGSVAFFVSALGAAAGWAALFHGAGHYPPDFTMPAFLAAAAACVGAATLAEAISPPHVDNLLVTYAAAATAFCLNESGIAPFLMQTCA